jgi:hypothetical protein
MSHEFQELESQLRTLRPAVLDPMFAARLENLANPSATTLDPAAAGLEASLGRLKPTPLPAEQLLALLGATSARETKVVPFPAAAPGDSRTWGRYMLPVAAAVALLGAATALLVPTKPADPALADNRRPDPAPPARVEPGPAAPLRQSDFVPAGFRTDLSQTSDEGVVWNAPNQPHRVVKVIYRDRLTFIDKDGGKCEVERPRVEYILVPEKLD